MNTPGLSLVSIFLSLALISLASCQSGSDSQYVSDQKPDTYSYEERSVIPTIDDRDLIFFIDRPLTDKKVPLLIMVDGSSCIGQLRPATRYDYRPDENSPFPYARLMVEKPGVAHDADYPSECSDEFLKYYTIEQRVFDHLRVLQYLKANASWFNGEVYIWGWSDGGDIAAQITAYYPNVKRAVLGAMGGGYTMEEHFKDFWICSKDRAGDQRDSCIEKLDAHFQDMFDNPTWTKTWSGQDNSWKIWPTRLKSRLSNVLKDNTIPILIVQGAEDFDSTPADSARKLVEDLESVGNESFTYWEIPNMEHGWGSLPHSQGDLLEKAMLDWLLSSDKKIVGMPDFSK